MRACRLIVATVAVLVLAGAETRPVAAQAGAGNASARLLAFVDDFVSAKHLEQTNDLSAASFAKQLEETRGYLIRLRQIDRSTLSLDDVIDWRFAESILIGRELAQSRMQYWKKDPRVYMTFRWIGTAIEQPGDAAAKAEGLLPALRAVPVQLENGRKNLAVYVPSFQELSVFMAEGARGIFAEEIPALARSVPSRANDLLAANKAAQAALESFIAFLKAELPGRPRGDFAIGRETYDAMLKGQYLLPYDSDGLYAYGWEQFNRTVGELEEVARRIDPSKTWQQLAVDIKNEGPDPTREIEAHQEWVNKARQHILSQGLMTIPWKERVDLVPRAEYLRKTSYYGNFSSATDRAADKDGTLVGQWQINPFDPRWDDKTKREYLQEHDWGVIIVTAPHETYGGHHVQGLYQMHNPRKLRRTESISVFTEGWGLYNEQLMQETGFFPDERIHLRQLQLRLWRIARVIWDVGIHTGKMSYADAVSLLSDRVGFLPWAAQLEVDASAEEPGYRIGYYMGLSEILKMRDEFRQKMGVRFSLSAFHEQLMKIGAMPPALMREALMATLPETK